MLSLCTALKKVGFSPTSIDPVAQRLYNIFSFDIKKVLNKEIRYQPYLLRSLAVAYCRDHNVAGFKGSDTVKP